jgi:hypothetical protein
MEPGSCPLALAIRRVLGLKRVVVTGTFIELRSGDLFSASEGLADWIFAFDQDGEVGPVTVELRAAGRVADLVEDVG